MNEGVLSWLLCADDLLLMGETIEGVLSWLLCADDLFLLGETMRVC